MDCYVVSDKSPLWHVVSQIQSGYPPQLHPLIQICSLLAVMMGDGQPRGSGFVHKPMGHVLLWV